MAGIAIGCGGYGFLASGIQAQAYGPLFGSILFCFGLMTVVAYKLALYTGTAGFIKKQGSNAGLLHCRQILYQLSHKGSTRIQECILSPLDLPNPGTESGSPALHADSLPTEL